MYLRDACKILQHTGACRESHWAFGAKKNTVDLDAAQKDAARFTISRYAQVNCTFDELKKAIYLTGPLLVMFPVYNATKRQHFWKPSQNGATAPQPDGYHAVVAVGYTKTGIVFRNSWGEDWHVYGYFTVPKDDIHCMIEAWSLYDTVSDAKYTTLKKAVRTKKKKSCFGCKK
jgi:Cysteine protease